MIVDGREDYFYWLISKVVDERSSRNDLDLTRLLYSIPFKVVVSNDSNREADGIGLRSLYEYETGNELRWMGDCTVLEVLVSIAKMVGEDVLGTYYHEDRVFEWFWMLIDNLGLRGVGEVEDVSSRNYICELVDKWLSRKFEYNGRGSPFPLKRPPEDQRTVGIWKQICMYLAENPWLED